MLYKIASYLANMTVHKGNQDVMKIPVLVYGFEIVLSQVFASSVMLLIGVVSGKGFESVVFLATFISLRLYCGGYHAETYKNCFISSIFLFILTIMLGDLLMSAVHGLVGVWSVGELASGVIIKKAPVININHPISDERRKKNRRTAVMILFIIDVAVILCILLDYRMNGVMVAIISKILVAVLIKLAIWKERRDKDE